MMVRPPIRHMLALPDGGECGDTRFLVELAVRAEAAGWEGVFVEDYVSYQGDPHEPTTNVWPALGAIAVRTKTILIGTSVTPLPRRRPWNVAREAVAVDLLSGGRFVLGVGSGDSGGSVLADTSLTRFGERTDTRTLAQMLDEGVEIIDGLWRGEPFAFRGRHYTIDDVTFVPRPLQQPRIPILVGGGYPLPGPTARALRWDGSMLYKDPKHDPDELGMTVDDVRALRQAANAREAAGPFTIAVGGSPRRDDWEAERAHIAAVGEAGADWWVEWIPPNDRETMLSAVERGPLR